MVNDRISEAKKFFELGKNPDLKDDEKKIKYFTKAIELNPNYAEAYYERGYTIAHTLTWHGSWFNSDGSLDDVRFNDERARDDFTKAIELNPKFVEAYFERGKVYYGICRRIPDPYAKKTIKDFEKVVELNPSYKNFEVYFELGCSYFDIFKDYKKTIDYCKKYLQNREKVGNYPAEDYDSLELIGKSNYELKNYEEAILYCNKAIESYTAQYGDNKYPYMFKINFTRGKSYAALGNYEKALEDYNEFVKNVKNAKDEVFAEVFYCRGLAYKELKMYNDAYWDFDTVIDIESKNKGERKFEDAYELRDECKYKNENDPEAKNSGCLGSVLTFIFVICFLIYVI